MHFMMGLCLPLCCPTESQPSIDSIPNGVMVRVSSVSKGDGVSHIRGFGRDGLVASTALKGTYEGPNPGEIGWMAGPCKRVKSPQNFSITMSSVALRCRGPFYQGSHPQSPPAWLALRSHYIAAIDTLESRDARGVLKAITLGDKREVSGQLLDKFTHAGANHLLAVSGLHVAGMSGIVYGLLIILFGYLSWSNPKPMAMLASCCFAYGLLLIADGPVGALRAFLTYFTISIMTLLGRRCDPVELICLAATMMVLEQPNMWRFIGFQLSFISVLSIVTLTKRCVWWRQAFEVSLWSTVATAPLCAYYFGTFTPSGILTNLILVPLATVVLMPSAWLGLWLMPLTSAPLELSGELAVYFVCVLERLHEVGSEMWVLGAKGAPVVGLFCFSLVLARLGKIYAALILLVSTVCLLDVSADEVHFLAIGQGDATLIKSEGQVALLDAGPKYSGQRLLSTCRRLGVRQINVLVISHQHPDHFEGLEALIGRIPIDRLMVPARLRTNASLKRIERALLTEGTDIALLDDETINIGHFSMRLFAPDPTSNRSENDASIAVLIEHKHGSVMVMGDLERKGEQFLMTQKPPRIDVLRVGHHGSRTSTQAALLGTLCPSHVVMSLGFGNHFGFPHRETIQRVRQHGAGLWRTDLDGRVVVTFNDDLKIGAVNQDLRPIISPTRKKRCYPPASTALK